jgi:hypothetical protein
VDYSGHLDALPTARRRGRDGLALPCSALENDGIHLNPTGELLIGGGSMTVSWRTHNAGVVALMASPDALSA